MNLWDNLVESARNLPDHFRDNVPPFFQWMLIGAVVLFIIGLIGNLVLM